MQKKKLEAPSAGSQTTAEGENKNGRVLALGGQTQNHTISCQFSTRPPFYIRQGQKTLLDV